VSTALFTDGGQKILKSANEYVQSNGPTVPTGNAVITTGGNLKAEHVIHTVGPVWRGGSDGEAGFLAESYANSLKVAARNKVRTIAFPSISTGAYGYPVQEASQVAAKAVKHFLEAEDNLDDVVLFFSLIAT
jgi:O-acetyl-ADP-ribose deacetylase (regulator of RNase III)